MNICLKEGKSSMNEARFIERTCVASVLTIIMLMTAVWSTLKILKIFVVIDACIFSMNYVRMAKMYIKELGKEANAGD